MPGGLGRRLFVSVAVVSVVIGPGAVTATRSVAATRTSAAAVVVPHDAPQTASIRIDPNAKNNGYSTPSVTMAAGGTLTVVNFDSIRHTVTSQETDSGGNPLFSAVSDPQTTTTITGASALAAGTYHFYCHFHPTTMRGTLTISGSGGTVQPAPVTFDQPLVTPKVLTTASIRIPVKPAAVRVLPTGPLTQMWTYAGTYPGPTIVRPAGHDTKVTFVNNLPGTNRLTMHFHGDHHKWTADGQPARFLIDNGKAHTYDFPLTDGGHPERAAFQWYHDHRMNATARNNWRGLQGMFIVTDGWTKKLGLPRGQWDVPLMVSERSFDANNQLTSVPVRSSMAMTGPDAPPNDGTVGDHILVNGRYAPYFNVAAHRYRLRLLNTSPFTTYNFALSDGHPFVQVGTGNGLLPKAVVRQSILLGPAQRVDVVVDFRGELGSKVVLQSIPRANPPKNGAGTPSAQIMEFRVNRSASDYTQVPATLEPAPKMTMPSRVSAVWTVGLGGAQSSGTYWTLDGKPFDPKRVVLKVPRGATRMWELRNNTSVTHFVHIHEEQWRTVLRDGKAPPAWERGLEDTWRLDPGEKVRVVAKFTDYLGVFMIHCHMLDHEDDGLMAQFAVVDEKTRTLPSGYRYVAAGGPAALASASSTRLVSARTALPAPVVPALVKSTGVSTAAEMSDWTCQPSSKARRVGVWDAPGVERRVQAWSV
jgi:spore coat protein A